MTAQAPPRRRGELLRAQHAPYLLLAFVPLAAAGAALEWSGPVVFACAALYMFLIAVCAVSDLSFSRLLIIPPPFTVFFGARFFLRSSAFGSCVEPA